MAVVTPIDRPNSARNRCVIEAFLGVFVLSLDFFFSGGMGVFVIRLTQIALFFS